MSNPLACPKCSYERKSSDQQPITQCPSCGVVFARYRVTQTQVKEAPQDRPQSSQTFTAFGQPIWLVALMCFGVFSVAWAYGTWSSRSQSSSPSTPIHDASAAQFACEGFVRDRLKAPATADFAPFGELRISGKGAGPWTVQGYVDSQNSFSAKLRTRYSCTVQLEGNSASLVNISL